MPIGALPTPPTTSDPANFPSRADAFVAALTQFVTDANNLASQLNALTGQVQWVIAGGTADAITATFDPAIALTDGALCFIRATAANATTTPTFAPNGLTAHTITKLGGVALSAGDIPAALAELILRYNLANTRWELLNPARAVTQTAGDNSTKAASTAYVDSVFQQKGTWTPFDNSGASLTFTGISAGYTKIGNMVHAYWQFFYPATASGASTIVAGLPFTVASANSASQAFVSYTNVTTAQHFRLSSGGTSGNICDATGNILTNATMSSGLFCGEAIYPVT